MKTPKETVDKNRVTSTSTVTVNENGVTHTISADTRDSAKISRNAKGDIQFEVSVYRNDINDAIEHAKLAYDKLNKLFPLI